MAEYKIKDLETLTGIKAHTIRIWEKRYGILSPERTETQIRTYNDEDLNILLNVSLLNKHGFKISRIAEMDEDEILKNVWDIKGNTSLDNSTEKLIIALLDLDENLFRNTFQNLIDKKGLEKAYIDTVIPFLNRIGVMWMVGSINPAQEHFMSNLIRQKISVEIDKLPIPKKKDNTILLFLPEHELHEISLLFYHYSFRKSGLNTIYLGQCLPYNSLLECIEKLKPKALVTSWLTSVEFKFLENYFKKLSNDTGQMKIFAGGAQINENAKALNKWIFEIQNIKDIVQKIS